jgi:(E)-2-((N-methylformamido)methylene)succinate hydrolase
VSDLAPTHSPNGTAYRISGRSDGPVVIMIHGLGLCSAVFDGMMAAFDAEYRVVRYDFWGHGDSSAPPAPMSLTVLSEQIIDLMDHLEINRASLVGFSIGGMINRRFALDHPDRLDALAVWNSPHERGVDAQVQVEARAAKVVDEGPMATMDAALQRWFTPRYLASGADGPARVVAWRGRVDVTSYPDACMVLAAGVTELIRPQTPITAPTHVLTCENDTGSTPAMSHAISREIHGAESLIVPDLQHLGLMEDPDAFAEPTLTFLNKVLKP